MMTIHKRHLLLSILVCLIFAPFVSVTFSFAESHKQPLSKPGIVDAKGSSLRDLGAKKRVKVPSSPISPIVSTEENPTVVAAQNSEISRLFREGRHLEALVAFEELNSETRQLATQLVAAKSAWALGLIEFARNIWNGLEKENKLNGESLVRVLLSHAIMEFQEHEYARATELAEKAIAEIDMESSSDEQIGNLKGHCWLVIADSYARSAKFGDARLYYEKAITFGNRNTAYEARLQLGRILLDLGDRTKAREALQGIGLDFYNAAEAIELLEDLELEEKNYVLAEKWSSEGLRKFMPYFHDDVRTYKRIVILNHLNRREDAQNELESLKAQYSEDNAYYIMGRALLAKDMLLSYFDPVLELSMRRELMRGADATELSLNLESKINTPRETMVKSKLSKKDTESKILPRRKRNKTNA